MGGGSITVDRLIFKRVVPQVWLGAIVFAMGALCHGIDSQMFGSLQTLKSFLNEFHTIINAKGAPAFTTEQTSLLNSVPWLGKFVGVIAFTFIVDPLGYRWGLVLGSVIQTVGVIMEMAAPNWQVFCAGRTIVYMAMGVYENVSCLYTAEVAPPAYRGFFVAFYPIMNSLGGLVVQCVVKGVEKVGSSWAWQLTCAVQFFPFLIIIPGVHFCVDSPRWHIQRGRPEKALASLQRLRTAEDEAAGWVDLEIEAINQAIELEKQKSKGSWIDCFRGTNLRRTNIIMVIWIANQWSGNQFMNSYAPTLYTLLGRSAQKFTYTIIYSVIGLFGQVLVMFTVDRIGRRPTMIAGCAMMSVFLLLMGGLGTLPSPSDNALNTMVACVVLFKFGACISVQQFNHMLSAELPALQLRRKTNSLGTAIDVVAAFGVTYSSPYLLSSPGANLGGKVAFIFGGFDVVLTIFSVLYVPEIKGRSLEEMDEMFEAKLWAWQFEKYQCTGVGAAVAAHGQGKDDERSATLAAKAGHPDQVADDTLIEEEKV